MGSTLDKFTVGKQKLFAALALEEGGVCVLGQVEQR